ncbi:MAG: DUF1918 domain-containing protein [Candidatus Aenigmarchaeota archaeon]|nr:DUF1918 domain-containing protein [Candidatus Aenigmarchaeota archaeon]
MMLQGGGTIPFYENELKLTGTVVGIEKRKDRPPYSVWHPDGTVRLYWPGSLRPLGRKI